MSPDLYGSMERLLLVLKADDILAKKVNEFRLGELEDEQRITGKATCYVTSHSTPFSTADRTGTGTAGTDTQSTIQLQITLVVNSLSTALATKKSLLDMINSVIRILRDNPRLVHPGTGRDPKCVRSAILPIEEQGQLRGKLIQSATILVKCQIGNQIVLNIPGIGDIPVLYQPVGRENAEYSAHLGTGGVLAGYAYSSEYNTRYYEVEGTQDLLEHLRTIKSGKEIIKVTVNTGDITEIFDGYLSGLNPGRAYDEIPTIMLRFEVT